MLRHVTLSLILLMALASCHKKEKAGPQNQPVGVSTIIVKPKTIPATFEYVGVAESSHPVEVRARVEGYLDKVAYKEGQLVEVGDLLFQIDPRPFQAALDNAKAEVARTKAILWDAERSVARLKPLYEKKAASQRDLDNAVAQELSAKANVDAAEAKVIEAELNLSFTTIQSPIKGLASKSNLWEGALVTPGGQPLTTISVIDPIWVDFNVSEGDILRNRDQIKKGQLEYPKDMNFTMEAVLSDGSVLPNKGKVDFANPTYQQTTGTLLVRATFQNPEAWLRPGQFVRAKANGAIRPNAITVPQKAVMQGNKGMFVYVVTKDGKADPRPVTATEWYEKDWIITAGLKPGDQVIVNGVNKLRPGALVKVQNGTVKE